jgi:hypothetical protein
VVACAHRTAFFNRPRHYAKDLARFRSNSSG